MIGGLVSALGLGFVAWLVVTDAPTYRFLVRLYEDKQQVRAMVDRWGGWAPIVFIGIQAMQVIIAPIPEDVTGLLGGFVFGQWLPPARGHLRAGHGGADVAAHELPRRGEWGDSLLYRLLDPRLTEGLRVRSLWRQSDAVLGLRGGVHARSHAGHLGSVGPGSQGGRGRISRTASSDGDPRGGRVTALLLSAPDRVVVPAARMTCLG